MKILSNFSFSGDQEFEICSFAGKFHDVDYGKKEQIEKFEDILERLPHGWIPDVVIFRTLMHWRIPDGIEKSPYLTIALLDDWYGGVDYLSDCCRLFDHVFTDKKGVELLNKLGIYNVSYWPHFGHDPLIFNSDFSEERSYDITYTGNFNQNFQRERIPWLKRISTLDKKYNIKMFYDLSKSEYAKVLNRTKIVFNRALKQEMNLRTFEAPACGALLFMEEENLEIRDFLEPDKEVILYNKNNLEELLVYYLEHDDERKKIAMAGYRKIQNYTYEKLFGKLLEDIRKIKKNRVSKPSYLFTENYEHCKYVQSCLAINGITNVNFLDKTKEHLDKFNGCAMVSNDCAVFMGMYTFFVREMEEKRDILKVSISLLKFALKQSPNYLLLKFNLAQLLKRGGDNNGALELYKEIFESVEQQSWDSYKGVIYPTGIGFPFAVLWSMCLVPTLPDWEKMKKERHKLLRYYAAHSIGDVYSKLNKKKESFKYYSYAYSLIPWHHSAIVPLALLLEDNIDVNREYIAQASAFNGLTEVEIIEKAIKVSSFNSDLMRRYVQFLFRDNKKELAVKTINESILSLSRIQDSPKAKVEIPNVIGESDSLKDALEILGQVKRLVEL